jgi:hypothetical protein
LQITHPIVEPDAQGADLSLKKGIYRWVLAFKKPAFSFRLSMWLLHKNTHEMQLNDHHSSLNFLNKKIIVCKNKKDKNKNQDVALQP